MKKIYISLMIVISSVNVCYADGFELTDVIKEAREAKNMQVMNSQKPDNIKPVTNSKDNSVQEQNACEKINQNEVIKQSQN